MQCSWFICKLYINRGKHSFLVRQCYRAYPVTHSQLYLLQCVIQCVILYGQSGRADGLSVWLRKTPSPHFQFSTLMNHNQIIHKLPPQFQTNNMAQKRVWLWVWICLVKRQQVDELAQLVFGQPAAENCITKSAWGAVSFFTKQSLCLSVSVSLAMSD